MQQYKDMLNHILDNGTMRTDRTGVGTLSHFGYQTRFDLSEGFPIVTIKQTVWKPVVSELLWFLEGSTDERRLAELLYSKPREELINKTTVWTANADNQGVALGYENNELVKELGNVYGAQWRSFGGIGETNPVDQIKWVVEEINRNPDSRRLIVSAWNPLVTEKQALPPCHTMFQFYVSDGKLSCQLYQRSADTALGVPFNIASYSLLVYIVARITNLEVGEFVHTIGDLHLYSDHIEPMKNILNREPLPLPTLTIEDSLIDEVRRCVFEGGKFSLDAVSKVKLNNYQYHEKVKLNMAV